MKREVKAENNVATATRNSNRFRRGGGELTKIRTKFEGETVKMDKVCFDCSDRNDANNYSQGMRKVAEHFGKTARYRTDIQSTIMKEYPEVIASPVKVNTGNADIENMLLVKQLSEWVPRTRKL